MKKEHYNISHNSVNSKRKPRESPISDPRQVVDWLIKNSPVEDLLFESSLRTVILFVHDLTLLKITPDHFIDEGNTISLWPTFTTKNRFSQAQTVRLETDGFRRRQYQPTWLRNVIALSTATARRGPLMNNLFAKPVVQPNNKRVD